MVPKSKAFPLFLLLIVVQLSTGQKSCCIGYMDFKYCGATPKENEICKVDVKSSIMNGNVMDCSCPPGLSCNKGPVFRTSSIFQLDLSMCQK